jgi:hypothetical protein
MAAAKAAKEEQDAVKAKGKSKADGKGAGGKSPPRALGRLSKPAEPETGNGKTQGSGGPPPAPPRRKKKRSGRRR